MADDPTESIPVVAHSIMWEFARACERDAALGIDYLRARDRWHAATTDEQRDDADDAFIDVLERFTDARNVALTNAEVRALQTLRNRPDR